MEKFLILQCIQDRYLLYIACLVITIGCGNRNTHCQTLSIAGKKIKWQPAIFDAPSDTFSNNPNLLDYEVVNRRWVVYSDRPNKTYNAPVEDSDNVRYRLQFMQPYFVVRDSGDFVQLMKYGAGEAGEIVADKFRISETIQIRDNIDEEVWNIGWIRKEKLLLWPNSFKSDRFKYSKRALILKRDIVSDSDFVTYVRNKGMIPTYNDPFDSTFVQALKLETFSVVYPYKKLGSRCLVGYTNSLTPINSEINKNLGSNSFGWIDTCYLTVWKNNLCIDINDTPDVQNLMSNKNVSPTWFAISDQAKEWKQDHNGSLNYVQKDSYDNFCGHNQLRAILLNTDPLDRDIVEVAGLTTFYDEKGKPHRREVDTTFMFPDSAKVVFVVSFNLLSQYGREIFRAIENIKSPNTKVGAIVAYATEFHKGCKQSPGFMSCSALCDWLSLLVNREGANLTGTGGVSDNILAAIDTASKMFFTPFASNIIVVVGEKQDTSIKFNNTLTEHRLANANATILAFQLVGYRGNDIYDRFHRGLSQIIIKSGMLQSDQLYACYRDRVPRYSCEWFNTDLQDTVVNNYVLADCSLSGGFMYPQSPKVSGPSRLNIDYLPMNIRTAIYRQRQNNMMFCRAAANMRSGRFDSTAPTIRKWNFLFLLDSLFKAENVNADGLELVKLGYNQYFRHVYTSMHVNGIQRPIYKRYLFASDSEFVSLMRALEQVKPPFNQKNAYDEPEMRIRIKNVAMRIAHIYLGGAEVISYDSLRASRLLTPIMNSIDINNGLFNNLDTFIEERSDKGYLKTLADFYAFIYEKIRKFPFEYTYERLGMGGAIVKFYYIPEDFLIPPK